MINAKIAAWILTILLILGSIISIVKAARKSNSDVVASLISSVIQMYLYYCVGIFALL